MNAIDAAALAVEKAKDRWADVSTEDGYVVGMTAAMLGLVGEGAMSLRALGGQVPHNAHRNCWLQGLAQGYDEAAKGPLDSRAEGTSRTPN